MKFPPVGLKGNLPLDILWMEELLHHFETIGRHCLLVFSGDSSETRVSERWCEADFVHPQHVLLFLSKQMEVLKLSERPREGDENPRLSSSRPDVACVGKNNEEAYLQLLKTFCVGLPCSLYRESMSGNLGPPSTAPFTVSFFGEGSPTTIGYRKRGTLLLTSPLEGVVVQIYGFSPGGLSNWKPQDYLPAAGLACRKQNACSHSGFQNTGGDLSPKVVKAPSTC